MNLKNKYQPGTLFLIPTPIGNLADLTIRSLELLKSVDLLLCEDTRHTQILLDHYGIKISKLSFHEHNSQQRIPEVIEKLKSGLNLGLVSDAGMPVISDPGRDLVQKLRELNLPVVALPGANAALTALVGSGFMAIPYTFLGFLPRNKQEIKDKIDLIKDQTIIFYESPYRLVKTLAIIAEIDPQWEICVSRELTKIHEEYFLGQVSEALNHFQSSPPKGEFVVILKAKANQTKIPEPEMWPLLIDQMINNGDNPNRAIKKFAKRYHLQRKIVYDNYHQIKR